MVHVVSVWSFGGINGTTVFQLWLTPALLFLDVMEQPSKVISNKSEALKKEKI